MGAAIKKKKKNQIFLIVGKLKIYFIEV